MRTEISIEEVEVGDYLLWGHGEKSVVTQVDKDRIHFNDGLEWCNDRYINLLIERGIKLYRDVNLEPIDVECNYHIVEGYRYLDSQMQYRIMEACSKLGIYSGDKFTVRVMPREEVNGN